MNLKTKENIAKVVIIGETKNIKPTYPSSCATKPTNPKKDLYKKLDRAHSLSHKAVRFPILNVLIYSALAFSIFLKQIIERFLVICNLVFYF